MSFFNPDSFNPHDARLYDQLEQAIQSLENLNR